MISCPPAWVTLQTDSLTLTPPLATTLCITQQLTDYYALFTIILRCFSFVSLAPSCDSERGLMSWQSPWVTFRGTLFLSTRHDVSALDQITVSFCPCACYTRAVHYTAFNWLLCIIYNDSPLFFLCVPSAELWLWERPDVVTVAVGHLSGDSISLDSSRCFRSRSDHCLLLSLRMLHSSCALHSI